MAFNKNKALENALKYLSQGKPAQAIAEYQQILRHDGKDQATLMTVGDLFARQGDMPQAVEYFERLAQVYLNDGFNSKAIAIYKKIAKLAPNELAPLERLADLYVQQGVLSEARPLFLQIAEAHLKANHAPKAVEVLNRLLEVEPDNPRVQMRLAELYNVMGQKKEAAHTYFNYAQRLFEREETDEAQKLIARAIELEPENSGALLLEAKIFHLANKPAKAVGVLAKHPEADAGGEVTNLLIDWDLEAGHFEQAADRARNQLLRGSSHIGHLQKVLDYQIEKGQAAEALPLLSELREPSIEAGEQEKFLKSLVAITEKAPGNIEALEMLADFSRHTSDPFQLSSALSRLVDAYSAQGDFVRAEEALQELIEKNKGDERLQERLAQLRAGATGKVSAPAAVEFPAPAAMPIASDDQLASIFDAPKETEPVSDAQTTNISEEPLDDETQLYIAQALTDVDLFSSYGLTQKATVLLESVLERAPRHTPTLERLLDLYVGAGNNRRTAEVAAQLEQIHLQRDDSTDAERFTEIRERYEKLAGLTREDLQAAAAPPPPAKTAQPPAAISTAEPAAPQEMEVPLPPPADVPEVKASAPAPAEFEIPVATVVPEAVENEPAAPVAAAPEAQLSVQSAPAPAEEVDLSDEWEAMVQDVSEPAKAAETVAQELAPEQQQASVPETVDAVPEETLPEAAPAPPEPEPEPASIPLAEESADESPIELVLEPASNQQDVQEDEVQPEPAEEVADASGEIELELAPQPAASNGNSATPKTADDFLSELNAELDAMEPPAPSAIEPAAPQPIAAKPVAPRAAAPAPPVTKEVKEPVRAASNEPSQGAPTRKAAPAPVAAKPPGPQPVPVAAASVAPPEPSPESLNQLAEVFQEFRNELGEMPDEDEDLETHYNLGIAYREMGLLDEAIGEFQKVAQAVQRGKPFAYSMNCAAMLALSFMDKGEPKIAALWYERALKTPGLDQDAILALRYDLGISLESAGESASALDHFRQVYAMNIDYRDVADRIAMLQKH
jgi:tetratricopeptide (TPR) repeat protein